MTADPVPADTSNELRTGTLCEIADGAGAQDFDEFCDWIDRNA
ncbi:hypothetical protein [Halorubrum halophilum]|nr:hypothetical protein [Halorubrum halophilum]